MPPHSARPAPGAIPVGRRALPLLRGLWVALAVLGLVLTVRAQSILPDPVAGEPYSFGIVTNPAQPAGTTYTAQGLPAGLSVDPSTGIVTGTTLTVGEFKGTLLLSLNGVSNPFLFQITVDPQAGASTITSQGSAFGTVGTPFSYAFAATNGPSSYNVAQLPPGLSASGSQIAGTPTTAGLFFTSTSANNGSGQGALLVLMFTISPAGPIPADTSTPLISAQVGTPFSFSLTATNSPTSFSASGLPAGLTLNTSTGVISGTPTTAGVASVPIEESNAFGSSRPLNLILTIGDYSSVTSALAVTGPAGSTLSYTVAASNAPSTFVLTGLPEGLSYNPTTGVVSGMPTTAGTYTVTAVANNALGAGPAAALVFSITDPATGASGPTPPLILVPPASETVVLGSTARFSVDAVGTGTLGYQWSLNGTPISGESGPALTLDLADSTDAGSYTVTVTSPLGAAVSSPAILTVLSLFIPPSITSAPQKLTATAGSPAALTVGASGTEPLTYQWLLGGVPVGGATAATLSMPSVSVADAGTYSAVVTNPAGSSTSAGAVLTVSPAAFAPIFQYQPSSVSVTTGGTATLLVGIVGSPPTTFQWSKGGVAIPGATSAALVFSPAEPADAGTYSVVITDPAGFVSSSDATLVVQPAGGPPVPISIVVQPNSTAATQGGSATFTVSVTGDPSITYQWRKNQSPIPAATSPSFTVIDVHPSDAGSYDVEVSNLFSATISSPAALVVTPVGVPSRLVNVSARGLCGTGAQALIVGFVVGGSGTESALVRAVGPTLSEFGVAGVLAAPQLVLNSAGGVPITSDAVWGGTPALTSAFAQAGAFPLPAASLDSAVLTSLQPGPYTAVVTGTTGGTGVVLLEAYDADTSAMPTAHYTNVSARGFAGTGNQVLTVGFVIVGSSGETVLIRGVGPGLSSFSVSGALANPQLTVVDSNQNIVGSNGGWGGTAALQAAFEAVSAFQLSTTSADAAILLTLPPGAYTAQVSGANGSTGIALVELYEMP